MRPFSTYRQWHGETRIDARLDYAAGALRLAAGRPTELYRMDVLYDGDRYVPVSDYDAARGGVTLGLQTAGQGGLRVRSSGQLRQTASVTFSPKNDLVARRRARRRGRRHRAGRAPRDRPQARGRGKPRDRSILSTERGALPDRGAERGRGGALGPRSRQQPLRPDRVRGRGGTGHAGLRWGVDVERRGVGADGAGRGDAAPATRDRRPDHAGQVSRRRSSRRAWSDAGRSYLSPGYDQATRHLDIDVTTAVGGVTVDWLK